MKNAENMNREKNILNKGNSFLKKIYSPITAISLWTSIALSSCMKIENDKNIINEPPKITIFSEEISVNTPKTLSVKDNEAFIWDELIASRNDDKTDNCSVSFIHINKYVYPWELIDKQWNFLIMVSDDDGKTSYANVRIIKNKKIQD